MTSAAILDDLNDDITAGRDDPIPIRLMREGDLPAVMRMDEKANGRERADYFRTKVAACVREPKLNTSLVAEKDGIPIGFLMARLFFGEFGIPATRAVLDTLGVDPAFAGQGVAAALFSQFQKNMAGLRVEAIDTLVDWDRFDLLGFFQSVGFHRSREMHLVWDLNHYPFRGRLTPVRVRDATPDDSFASTGRRLRNSTLRGRVRLRLCVWFIRRATRR